jgi:hypothetical protein
LGKFRTSRYRFLSEGAETHLRRKILGPCLGELEHTKCRKGNWTLQSPCTACLRHKSRFPPHSDSSLAISAPQFVCHKPFSRHTGSPSIHCPNLDPRWLKIEPMAVGVAYFVILHHLSFRTSRAFFCRRRKKLSSSLYLSLTLSQAP